MKTHKNFKSLDPKVPDANAIFYLVGEALEHQHAFEKGTARWEMDEWEKNKLENFRIELEKIDRLYYINFFNRGYRNFELIGRMEYDGGYLFIHMTACCNYLGFNCDGHGKIFISSNPMWILLSNKHPRDKIYRSLVEDDIHNDEDT